MHNPITTLNPARRELLELFALDIELQSGAGSRLRDADGKDYVDFLSQYGALPFGHNPPEIWEALAQLRIDQRPTMIQPLRSIEAERLADRLAEVTPGDLAITTFTNSGAETVEAAIKLARLRTGRRIMLSTRNGFHGKTLGALSTTGKPVYQEGFAVPVGDVRYIPYGDLEALRAALAAGADEIAGFIFEPIQGEGGVICPPQDYLDGAIALCREYGVLSILDEIQTGMGRTGTLFACSEGAEVPDMLLLSKALGGGMLPIGACIVRPAVWDDRFGRLHSSTFAGNTLACRAALATIDLMLKDNQALIRRVAQNGAYLRGRLEALQAAYPSVIHEVRGRGYMLGLSFQNFDETAHSAVLAFASLNGGIAPLISSYLMNRHGILTAPVFNSTRVVRLQPALTISREEIDIALAGIEDLCAVIAASDCYTLCRHLVVRPVPAQPMAEPAPAAEKSAAAEPSGRFAFLIHYTEEEDIFRSDPSFRQFDETELQNWCEWAKTLGPGFARRIPAVRSKAGADAEGWLVSVPLLPKDMRGAGRASAARMVSDAVDLSVEDGAARVGLGAFTSIATRGGESVTGRGAPITSGNTLTTVSAVESIRKMARRTGIALETAHVVVVGASGAIGRLASMMLAREAGRLTLVGNAANPFSPGLMARTADEVCEALYAERDEQGRMHGQLQRDIVERMGRLGPEAIASRKGLAERLRVAFRLHGDACPLDWGLPLEQALQGADIVLVATSADTTLIHPADLAPGTLVCDVARPPNVARDESRLGQVLVFDGGLIKPPFEIDLGPFQTLPQNLCWGCLGETVLLALSREDRDFSIGSSLSLADADHIAMLAEAHGFEPAPPQWYGKDLAVDVLAEFERHVQTRYALADLDGAEVANAARDLAQPSIAL